MATTSKFTPRKKASAPPSKPAWKPLGYMRKAMKFMVERGAAALLLDPGLRKTSITYGALKTLRKEGQLRAAIVFAPKRVALSTWPKEQAKWADFADLSVGVLHGPKLADVLAEDHDVYVTNYESIPKFFTRVRVGKLWKYRLTPLGVILMEKVNVLVWDELSKMKHNNTLRFKLVAPWVKKFDRRYGLTGSVASNGLMDLFGQCYVLDEGRSLGQYITHYREQYFIANDKQGWSYRLKHGAEEQIYERLRPLALRMSAEDHLELPPVRDFNVKLDFPAELRKHYTELEDEFLTQLKEEVFTAKNAAAANNVCRQFCSGAIWKSQMDFLTGIKKAGPREYAVAHNEKLDALEELLEELQGQQVLIGYEFIHDWQRITERFPKIERFGVSDKKDLELEAAWNAGTVQWAMGHPASIAHGLNLQESNAHNVVWYTVPWNFENYDQFIRRLKRSGNTAHHINNYRLVMRDSIDESTCAAMSTKKRTQDALYEALKTRKRLDE